MSLCLRILLFAATLLAAPWALADPKPSIAMHGDPALAADFAAFPYADADAPKGGTVTYGVENTYNSVNPFIVTGAPCPGVNTLVFETLMMRSLDEPFSFYPWIAKAVETAPDRSWVEFSLDPRAKFSDGSPVTAEDVKFSMELLREKGRPGARTAYGQIASTEIRDPHTIRFVFKDASNRELPLIMAGMPVLPKHAIDPETFDKPTIVPMIASGPYVFGEIKPGVTISFRRNPDWWAKDLPSTRGLFNFDEIRYEFYRDANTMFEAFRTGQIDVRAEGEAVRWAQDYNFPAAAGGKLVRQEIGNRLPRPMLAFVFNTRRQIFADARVREALTMLFDFEWLNPNLFMGLYQRTCSFFENSELSSCGVPASDREKALLAPFPGTVAPEVMAGTWRPPLSDGSGKDRILARKALALLRQAGYAPGEGVMRSADGKPLAFEMLAPDRLTERLALNFADNAKRLGIAVTVRVIDDAQFQARKQSYDFDVIEFPWQSSLSPGNEQNYRWSSAAADTPGSFNFAGVKSPAADAMIKALLAAQSREELVAAVRALDRVLISGHYVLPLYYAPKLWIARWNRTVRPDKPAMAVGAYGDTLASDPILAHLRVP